MLVNIFASSSKRNKMRQRTKDSTNIRRARIGAKLYWQIFASPIRLGDSNNKLLLYCDQFGNTMRKDNSGNLVSMDKTTKYISPKSFPVIYTPTTFENQHYGKHSKNRKVLYFTASNGQSEDNRCSMCNVLKHISDFNKNKMHCRECQAKLKAEYRETDTYVYSYRRRNKKLSITNDKTVTVKAIKTMFEEQKGKCALCHISITPKTMHKDHIIPISKGGAHSIINIQLLCAPCNLQKSDKI